MQYLNMRPHQLREAIINNTPVALPLGVIEYHAEHLPLGTDSFVTIDAVHRAGILETGKMLRLMILNI